VLTPTPPNQNALHCSSISLAITCRSILEKTIFSSNL
jgi:hypothetical protein